MLIDAIEICNSTAEEFFWEDISKYKHQKELVSSFEKLSSGSKETILNLIQNMK